MNNFLFPAFYSTEFKKTKDQLQSYSRLLSDIKSKYTPHQKNWEEFSLKIYAKGLTTTPIPVVVNEKIETLDLNLNLIEHQLKIFCGSSRLSIPLFFQSFKSFSVELVTLLNELGIEYNIDIKKFDQVSFSEYDKQTAATYWDTLKQIYFIMQEFKGSLMEETSNINFWPHHFDLSMLWFSGRLIPEQDPLDWDYSREQMNFGFSAGNEKINVPYFYITSYLFNEELLSEKLPHNAYWHTEGWKGAILKYSELVDSKNPKAVLLEVFNEVLSLNKKLIGI